MTMAKKNKHHQAGNPGGEQFSLPAERIDAWQTALNSVSDLSKAADATAEIVGRYLEYDLFEMNMLDIATGLFTPHRIGGKNLDPEDGRLPHTGYRLGEGLTGWLVEHRRPLVLEDIHQERHLKPALEPLPAGIRSYLGLPILINGDLIGTLEIAHRDPAKYGHEDLQTMEKIRDAIAVKLASLLRNDELRAVQQVAAVQQEILDKVRYLNQLDTLIAELGKILRRQLDSDWVAFLIFRPETSRLETLHPITYRTAPQEERHFSLPSPPEAPFSSLWQNQDYWIVNHIHTDEIVKRLNLSDALSGIDAERFLLAPLTSELNRFGVIVAGRLPNAEAFTDEQGWILNTLGAICGSLLQTALSQARPPGEDEPEADRSGQQPSQQSSYTQALLQITGELAASMDLDHLLARVLSMLRRAVGADQGAFLLTVPDSEMLILRASSGDFPAPPPGGRPTAYQSGVGLAGWVIENRMAVNVADLPADERWIPFGDEPPRLRSALAAPLIVAEEVLGTVLLLGKAEDKFNDDDLQLVTAAANQIAPAIHNAQLYHLIQEQAERLGLALRSQQVESSQSQAVLHAMTDGVIVTDPQHNILVFNPAAEQILDMSRTELLGESVFSIFERFGTIGQEFIDQMRSWESQGPSTRSRRLPPQRIETERQRVLAIQPAPVVLGADYLGTITILRDITREVEVDRMKSEFVATVSHELRSPITPIKGFVDLLRMDNSGELSDRQVHYLEIIHENIERLEMLVDELLDISRIEAGKVVLSFQPLSVEQLLGEMEGYVGHRAQTENKQISIETYLEGELADIWGDPERVRQILTNLVDNSFDYTPEGGKISIAAQQVGDQIEIAVHDNGMGIAVGEQERIFERFYRGEQALIMGVAGAGLGLSIAMNMVEMHGGRIWVNSPGIPGKGSTFTVSLPLAAPDTQPQKVEKQR